MMVAESKKARPSWTGRGASCASRETAERLPEHAHTVPAREAVMVHVMMAGGAAEHGAESIAPPEDSQ